MWMACGGWVWQQRPDYEGFSVRVRSLGSKELQLLPLDEFDIFLICLCTSWVNYFHSILLTFYNISTRSFLPFTARSLPWPLRFGQLGLFSWDHTVLLPGGEKQCERYQLTYTSTWFAPFHKKQFVFLPRRELHVLTR